VGLRCRNPPRHLSQLKAREIPLIETPGGQEHYGKKKAREYAEHTSGYDVTSGHVTSCDIISGQAASGDVTSSNPCVMASSPLRP
jgi:hypothetical protein